MPVATIRVRPATAQRREFAAWAIRQAGPRVRTVSSHEFAVPAELVVRAPEELLAGATIDGALYTPAPAPAAPAEVGHVCEPCGRTFPKPRGLTMHHRRVHGGG